MAAELSTKILHEFIEKAAKHIAREQTTDGIIDQQTLRLIRRENESTVKMIADILDKIKKIESGERYNLDLTNIERTSMEEAPTMRTGQTIFNAEAVQRTVTFKKNNIDLFPPFQLNGDSAFVKPILTQMSSIVVESVTLVLGLIGINIEVDNNSVRRAIGNATRAVTNSRDLNKDVHQIMTDMDDGNAMGKDIFMLVINMYIRNRSDLWDIVKSFLDHIPLNQWYVIVGQISAFIGMMVATHGTAKIAKLTMELGNFTYFRTKLNDLRRLEEMRPRLPVVH